MIVILAYRDGLIYNCQLVADDEAVCGACLSGRIQPQSDRCSKCKAAIDVKEVNPVPVWLPSKWRG